MYATYNIWNNMVKVYNLQHMRQYGDSRYCDETLAMTMIKDDDDKDADDDIDDGVNWGLFKNIYIWASEKVETR